MTEPVGSQAAAEPTRVMGGTPVGPGRPSFEDCGSIRSTSSRLGPGSQIAGFTALGIQIENQLAS